LRLLQELPTYSIQLNQYSGKLSMPYTCIVLTSVLTNNTILNEPTEYNYLYKLNKLSFVNIDLKYIPILIGKHR